MRNLILSSIIFIVPFSYAKENLPMSSFGVQLCLTSSDYVCITVKKEDTWEKMWEDPDERDIVKRVNRTNNKLRAGMILAVPKDLENTSIWEISPFPKYIQNSLRKLIIVDQNKLAWGIYDPRGELQWWGPISSGRDQCSDSNRICKTVTGKYYVFDKKSIDCVSTIFPIGKGGAKMPYCMYFYRGFALHGSDDVPGYRDSHGCIRLFTEDAKWLNEQYIDLPSKENNFLGTKVIIKELVE
ncbi:enhanced entry protein EnhA [Legionella lansingensis]|uniref:Enhanced entry protein EnhA n=1 Tax=Legionella lansingensis TaxID=45067 RepID=A0A0W0VXA1_9GAMM|nr:L,D-transpeptidase [Legionella lansingensis]KTD24735.1 enhanced entry protein EnhA [Legionella lansingensis]SNV53616.1 enhanced entry protein EnhA [Legionella lansingensis]